MNINMNTVDFNNFQQGVAREIKKNDFDKLQKVITATDSVGAYVIGAMSSLSNDITMDNDDLDKILKQITELKVFAEYLFKLKKKLLDKLKVCGVGTSDFVPYIK